MGLFDYLGRGQRGPTKAEEIRNLIVFLLVTSAIIFVFYSCEKKHKEFINSPEQVELRKQNELNQLRKRIIELESK